MMIKCIACRCGLGLWVVMAGFLLCGAVSAAGLDENASSADHSNVWQIPFLTLRNKSPKYIFSNKVFGSGRGMLRQGYCDVEWSSLQLLENISNSAPIYVPTGTAKITQIREIEANIFWNNYKTRLGQKRPVLYIHGFNIGFDKGCKRSRVLQSSLALRDQLMLFSWPSNGVITSYTHDEADINWSVKYIEETLLKMVDLFGEGGFDVIAHSMGTRGVFSSLVRLSENTSNKNPLIGRLIFLAPDIDAAVFKQRAEQIRSVVEDMTLYVSDNDAAMTVSKELHGYPRLGQPGEHLSLLRDIEIIDVSDIPLEVVTGHLYHLGNKRVIQDIAQIINQRLQAELRANLGRRPQLGKHYWKLLVSDK